VDGPAHILAYAPLGQPAMYVRANTAVPLWPEMNYVGQREADPLTFVLYPCEGSCIAMFYEDAGEGYEHLNGDYARRGISCEVEAGHIRVVIGEQEGAFVPTRQRIQLELREVAAEPEVVQSGETFATWHYDPERRCLLLSLDETTSSKVIELSMKARE
jgi:alpha-glucosidase